MTGLIVSVNNIAFDGLLQADITASNYFSADSFSLTFALGRSPRNNLAFWADVSAPYIAVSSADSSYFGSFDIISGNVDSFFVDPILRTVSIEGRDLSSRLIDSYLQRDFVNQTASEIVETIAADHGLDAQVTATSGSVGRFFEDGYTKLSLGQYSRVRSNWDLVVQLARERGFDTFVNGATLVFQPGATASDVAIEIRPGDVSGMRLERNLTVEPAADVRVQSWNSQQMASYTAATSRSCAVIGPGSSAASPQRYLFSRSNLTSTQTDLMMEQYAGEIARLRTILHLEMPWDLAVSARSLILLQGTRSSFDGLYQVDNLERRYSSVLGSTQSVRAVSWPVVY